MNIHNLVVLLILLLPSCHLEKGQEQDILFNQAKILFGQEAKLADMPFLVSLIDDSLTAFCTGTIIEKRFILTAAHCLYELEEITIDHFGQQRKSKKIYLHPDYDHHSRNKNNDIALIELSDEFMAAHSLNFHHLNTSEHYLKMAKNKRTKIQIAGVGADEYGQRGVMKKSYTYLHSIERLRLEHYHLRQGTCYGDSGGPSFITHKGAIIVLGVASTVLRYPHSQHIAQWSQQECLSTNFHTRIDRAYHWIKETIANVAY